MAKINLVLGLFNLIPGLPLDGGQVLKAALWQATGDRFQAVRLAAKAGQILGYVAIAFGFLVDYLTGELVTGLWIVLLGWFGIRNATRYDRVAILQSTLLQLTAADVMTRNFRVVNANSSLRSFADMYLLAADQPSQSPVYFAESDGRYRGLVTIDDLRLVERSNWETQTLQTIVHPLTEIPTVNESTDLADVINQLESENLPHITVLTPAGAVAGVIDRGDIVQSLAVKLNLRIADTEIKRIKTEGNYPPGLELGAISRGLDASRNAKSTKN